MKYKLVIFDCDGVLIDSEVLYRKVVIEEIQKLGLDMPVEDIQSQFVGIGYKTMESILEEALQKPLPINFRDNIIESVFKLYETELKTINGIEHVLESLNIPKCIASNSTQRELKRSLSVSKVENYFHPDHVFCIDMVQNGKPDPDLYLYAAEKMGVDPADCIVIEDSLIGVKAAVAAGISVIGFTGAEHASGDLYAEALKKNGAMTVVSQAKDLLPLIL